MVSDICLPISVVHGVVGGEILYSIGEEGTEDRTEVGEEVEGFDLGAAVQGMSG